MLWSCVLTLFAVLTVGASATAKGEPAPNPKLIIDRMRVDGHIQPTWKIFLVGTSRYDSKKVHNLPGSDNDALALANRFIQLGVPYENITILTSEPSAEFKTIRHMTPTKANIETAFQEFVANLTEGDGAFVYFSGYGFSTQKHDYIVPQDVVFDNILASSISLNDMVDALRKSPAAITWMTIDASRDDSMRVNKDVAPEPTAVTDVAKNDIGDSKDNPSTFVLLQSSEYGQLSYLYSDQEHSYLTFALLEALQPDINPVDHTQSGKLNLVDLLAYVQNRTEELLANEGRGRIQRPVISCANLSNVPFLFNLLTTDKREQIETEEKNFDDYLSKGDFVNVKDSLRQLAELYPEGEKTQSYITRKEKLTNALLDAVPPKDPETSAK